MAYSVRLFAVTGDPVVQRLLPQLVDAVTARVPEATVLDYHDGVAIAWCELASPGHDSSVIVQVVTAPSRVRFEVQRGLEAGGPERLTACDTVVELIPSSDVNWEIVRTIFRTAAERWSAILYDEGSGFDISIEDEI